MAASQGAAMFRVTMVLEGDVVIDRVLRGIESRAAAPFTDPAVVTAVVAAFRAITARAFASEGASTGASWAPLTPSTQRDRQRQGFPPAHPILQRTGKLLRALTVGDGAFVATRPTGLTYRLGAEVGYFTYHQSSRPRTKLPRRAPVLLTADDKTALVHPIRLSLTGRDPSAPSRRPMR
jgi:hypothetical protein